MEKVDSEIGFDSGKRAGCRGSHVREESLPAFYNSNLRMDQARERTFARCRGQRAPHQ
jgi:hypothetical protein